MRSGERCCCSRRRDDPETSGPCRDRRASEGKRKSSGGQRRSESKGAVTMDLQAAEIRNAGARYPGALWALDRGRDRKVLVGIAGREAPDPKPGRKVRWKGGPKGQVPDTGSQDLWPARAAPRGGCRMPGCKPFAERRRRKVGVGCSRRPGHASGLEGRCVANCRNGDGSERGVSQSRRSDDAGRRARKRPPFLHLGLPLTWQA